MIAGGGVAALEACLALRAHVDAEQVDIELLAPSTAFDYKPLSVLEPFERGRGWAMPLASFAADQDLILVPDGLAAIDDDRRTLTTTSGEERVYDLLLVAIGTQKHDSIPGALAFRGHADARALHDIVDRVPRSRRMAFVVPDGESWPLPMYELALLTAARLVRVTDGQVALVTPERAPLEIFGAHATEAVSEALERHHVGVMSGITATSFDGGLLHREAGEPISFSAVVTLPRLTGRAVAGLPCGSRGFIPVDEHGHVEGLERVYAAGDITNYPVKQGGLATQQADAAAESMLADIGLSIEPSPFRPRIRGVLYSDQAPTYLQSAGEGRESGPEPRPYSLWWPPSKIAGRYLSPYLTVEAGAPRAPEVRPAADSSWAAVTIDQPLD